MNCSTPGFSVLNHLPKLAQTMSIESVMPSNHLILWHPLFLPPSILLSIRVFSNESVFLHQVAKSTGACFNISPSNEYSGSISLQSKGLSRVFSNTIVRNISSSALSLLYGPNLTSLHAYWKNYSIDYTDLCWQSVGVLSWVV